MDVGPTLLYFEWALNNILQVTKSVTNRMSVITTDILRQFVNAVSQNLIMITADKQHQYTDVDSGTTNYQQHYETFYCDGTWCGKSVDYITNIPPNREILMANDSVHCSLSHVNVMASSFLCMVYIHRGVKNSPHGHHFVVDRGFATGRDIYNIVSTNNTHDRQFVLYLQNGYLLDLDYIVSDDIHLIIDFLHR